MKSPVDFAARSLAVALGTALALSLVLAVRSASDLKWLGNDQGYAPEQPIAFSHRLHAGELAVSCLYCHPGAERSRNAGIPPLALCMNCHARVSAPFIETRAENAAALKEGRKPKAIVSPEIRKIYDALGLDGSGAGLGADGAGLGGKAVAGKPVSALKWNRVHALSDFVYFDHRPHLGAGLACQTCHGPVETMDRMRQHADLSMGWCVNCHRRAQVEAPLLDWPKKAPEGRRHASTDCRTCHY